MQIIKLTGLKEAVVRNDIPASFRDNNGIFHVRLADFLLSKAELF